jgi:hypothetical protein
VNRWRLTAHCPRCRKVLWWRNLADTQTRAAFLALGCSGLTCPRHGEVDAVHAALLTSGQHPELRPMARGIESNDNNDTEETGT